MDKLLRLKSKGDQAKIGDLKTPNDTLLPPPMEHSTALRPNGGRQRHFFPSFSEDSPTKKAESLSTRHLNAKLNDMSAILNGISISENDITARSSLGLLPDSLLQTSAVEDENTFYDWRKSSVGTSAFKKPFTPMKKSASKSVSNGLDEKYFQPAPASKTQDEITLPLDLILGSTMGDISAAALDDTNDSLVFKDAKGGGFDLPSFSKTFDASFFRGAMSARSTSIGGSSQDGSNKTRTLDEKFDDFTKNSFEGAKIDDVDFGPVATDNLALIDAAEKETAEEHKFIPGDAMHTENAPSFTQQGQSASFLDVTSKSQYFSRNTSRLGSLETSTCPTPEELRPNLGLGKIVSPEKEPIKILEKTLHKTFTKEEEKDLKSIFSAIMASNGNNDLKDAIKKHLDQNANKDDTAGIEVLTSFLEVSQFPTEPSVESSKSRIPIRSPTTNKDKKGESVKPIMTTSILEASHFPNEETIKSPPRLLSNTKSRIPVKSPGGSSISKKIDGDKENRSGGKMGKPMMGLSSNNKLKPLSDHNKKLQRHSSPIKLPTTTTTEKAKVESNAIISSDFPIQSTRLGINWIAAAVNCSTEEIVVFKNVTKTNAAVNLSIRDSDEFTFADGKQSVEISMDPGTSLSMGVFFRPKSPGEKSGAALTIRVHGFRNSRGKAVKSNLPLRGFAGQPRIEMKSNELEKMRGEAMKLTLHEMPNDVAALKEMDICNEGDANGFFVIEAFLDQELTSKSDVLTGPIRVDEDRSVLSPGQCKEIALRIDPDVVESKCDPQYIGTLAIHWGSDLARKVLQVHKKANFPLKNDNLESIKRLFREGHEMDLKQCKMYKKIVNIYGAKNGDSFHSLPVEETLSESMMNVTANFGQKRMLTQTLDNITEELEEEEDFTISVERDKVFVPSVKVGHNAVVKVKLRNQGTSSQTLSVEGLKLPFSTRHNQLEVKPGFFLNLPILYAPREKGQHESVLTFKSITEPRMPPIHVVVKGSTLKS